VPVLTAAEIARICAGRVTGDEWARVSAIAGDSRAIGERAGFVAIRGGHEFVGDAFAHGAVLAIVERSEVIPDGATGVVVGDSVAALATLAAEVRTRLGLRVVGITGSTGKTMTKDFTAAALSARYRVHASPRSFNTEVGVPLVVLSCPDDAQVLVVEMGARHHGEIAELATIVRPDIGVVTGIGTTHIGEFGSRMVIARTKAELLASLPAGGLAVVPADDDFLPLLVASTSARVATVGPGGSVRFQSDDVELVRAGGELRGRTKGTISDVPITLPVAGRALMRNAAVAACVAAELGVPMEESVRAIGDARPTSRRMEIVSLGGWVVVNDAYNANPTSVSSALRTVRELAGSAQAWAVLGEMAELGDRSELEHARIGRLAAALGYSGLVVVGEAAAPLARAVGTAATRVDTISEAADTVVERVPPGAHLLVKGSLVTGLKDFGEVLAERLGQIPSRTG
jgi:UDP-N-acetylmuramoyl-tripeptide--D-alanyl-D-alanine ligase